MFNSGIDLGFGAWYLSAPTLTELIDTTITSHMDIARPDAHSNIETHLYNTHLHAKTCEYTLDVGKQLWLNQGRWSRLIKEYLPLEPWLRFQAQAQEILYSKSRLGATANMLFRDPDRYAKKHRWGGCLMGVTFRGDNGKSGPACLTFYSRTTYISYMGVLDAAIAAVMAREITPHEPIEFRWFISSQQFHSFKSLPFVYSHPILMPKLEKLERNRSLVTNKKVPPTWYHMARWYFKAVDGWSAFAKDPYKLEQNDLAEEWLGTEKYGPFRRIKRRWLEHKGILTKLPPKSLMIDELNFSKAV